jgi:hypothetical protein
MITSFLYVDQGMAALTVDRLMDNLASAALTVDRLKDALASAAGIQLMDNHAYHMDNLHGGDAYDEDIPLAYVDNLLLGSPPFVDILPASEGAPFVDILPAFEGAPFVDNPAELELLRNIVFLPSQSPPNSFHVSVCLPFGISLDFYP